MVMKHYPPQFKADAVAFVPVAAERDDRAGANINYADPSRTTRIQDQGPRPHCGCA